VANEQQSGAAVLSAGQPQVVCEEEKQQLASIYEIEKPGAVVVKKPWWEPSTKPGTKDETPKSPYPSERNPKYLIHLTFWKKPLGVVLTSDIEGNCAYVTEVDEEVNNEARSELPVSSKLVRVNGKNVESVTMDDIKEMIFESLETFPLSLTFCHPDGLGIDERAGEPSDNEGQ